MSMHLHPDAAGLFRNTLRLIRAEDQAGNCSHCSLAHLEQRAQRIICPAPLAIEFEESACEMDRAVKSSRRAARWYVHQHEGGSSRRTRSKRAYCLTGVKDRIAAIGQSTGANFSLGVDQLPELHHVGACREKCACHTIRRRAGASQHDAKGVAWTFWPALSALATRQRDASSLPPECGRP